MSQPHPKDMSPEEREEFHRAAEAEIQLIRYDKPVPNGRPKQNTWMVRRPHMQVVVQCVHDGGENNLHYHTNSETTWFVLKGVAVHNPEEGRGERINLEAHREWTAGSEHLTQY